MTLDPVSFIARTNLVLALVATVVGGAIWGLMGAVAAGVGGALGAGSFWLNRRLATRAIERVSAGAGPAGAAPLAAALAIKILALFGLTWVALAILRLPPVPFTLGISGLVVSTAVGGLWAGTRKEGL